jgi:hypothetical protein
MDYFTPVDTLDTSTFLRHLTFLRNPEAVVITP